MEIPIISVQMLNERCITNESVSIDSYNQSVQIHLTDCGAVINSLKYLITLQNISRDGIVKNTYTMHIFTFRKWHDRHVETYRPNHLFSETAFAALQYSYEKEGIDFWIPVANLVRTALLFQSILFVIKNKKRKEIILDLFQMTAIIFFFYYKSY